MKEEILKEYFENKIPVDQLLADLKDSQLKTGQDATSVYVTPITDSGDFVITRHHLLKICNDTLSGHLSATEINIVAFALISSDYFYWDSNTTEGEIVANTLFDWDNPDINFPLSQDNLKLWKKYLETGEYSLKTEG